MSKPTRISAFQALPPALRVAAAAESLPYLTPTERAEAALALLEVAAPEPAKGRRGRLGQREAGLRLDALRGLVAAWGWLSPAARRATLAVARVHWDDVLGPLARDRRWWARAGVADVIAEGGLRGQARRLVPLLSDRDKRVRRAAEAALEGLVVGCTGCAGAPASGGGIRARVEEAIRRQAVPSRREIRMLHGSLLRGIEAYEAGGSRAAFRAAALALDRSWLLPEPGSVLAEWLNDPSSEAHMVLRSVLRRDEDPRLGERAMEWLGRSHLAGACLDRLARPRSHSERERIAARAHQLLHPARARKARLIERPSLPRGQDIRDLSIGAQRGLSRLASAMSLSERAHGEIVGGLIRSEDPLARLACAHLTPRPLLEGLCFDRDAAVARTAALRWSRAGSAPHVEPDGRRAHDLRVAHRMARLGDPFLRRVGREEAARLDPLDAGPASGVLARAAFVADPEAALARLRRTIREGRPPERMRAVARVRTLRAESRVELELLQVASGAAGEAEQGGDRLVSVVASALGAVMTPTSRQALRALARHQDARVRANALEALARQARRADDRRGDAELGAMLWEAKADPHHRVRGAAVRWLLEGSVFGPGSASDPETLEALEGLLGDERPAHRVSALWAARRALRQGGSRAGAIADRIRRLAAEDEEHVVRVRARAVERSLGLVVAQREARHA